MVETRTKIVINGVEYSRIEDVPPEFRSLLEDRDGSGLPDALERGLRGKGPGTAVPIPDGAREISFTTEKHKEEFRVDGHKYDRLEDVPEPARSALRDALVPLPRPGPPAAQARREILGARGTVERRSEPFSTSAHGSDTEGGLRRGVFIPIWVLVLGGILLLLLFSFTFLRS
jgi:hypothetical protein